MTTTTYLSKSSLPFNVTGMSVSDNLEILQISQDNGFDGSIELNPSCPDVPGKPQAVPYEFELTKEILT